MKYLSVLFLSANLWSTTLWAAPTLYSNGTIYLSVLPEKKLATWFTVDAGHVTGSGTGTPPSHISETVDLQGRTVLPGFIDAHAHLLDIGKAKWEVELRGSKSADEAAARVKAFVIKTKPATGATIIGQNWDQDDWAGKTFPHRALLDSISTQHPIVLYRVDGHAAWVNTLALQQSGIWKTKSQPKGGNILKDKRNEPTGILIDAAMDKLSVLTKSYSPEEVARYATDAIAEAHSLGITGIHDAGIRAEYAAVIRNVVRTLPFRYFGMLSASDPVRLKKGLKAGPILSVEDDRFSLRTVKLYIDGAMGSRGAAFDLPYSDDPSNSGLLMMSEKELTQQIRTIDKAGFQIAIHAIGSKGNHIAINAIEKALGKNAATKRPRLEHAQVVTRNDILRMKKLGIIASMQPTHCTSDMKWVFKRIGEERARYSYAWRTVIDAGVPLAFGSDSPVELLNPWHGVYSALTRQDPTGALPPFIADERITLGESIHAFTQGAHFAGFYEKNLGTLSENTWADFVILKKDPFTLSPTDLRNIEVDETFVSGTRVFSRGVQTKS